MQDAPRLSAGIPARLIFFLTLAGVLGLPGISRTQPQGIIDERKTPRTNPAGTHSSLYHPLPPPGHFTITLNNDGRVSFDPILAVNLQQALDGARIAQGVPGASAAVLVPGQGIWQGVSGVSSTSPLKDVTSDMLFGIGSNTKAFISTTILTLMDDGLLSLDDSLGHWLPAYPNITGSVTIRQLMNMTSGLFDYLNDSNKEGDSVFADPSRLWTPEEIITGFVGPPHRLPGGPYSYCNTDYVLLGMVIKKVTHSSVSAQLLQRIFTPLSLDRTYLAVEEPLTPPIADPWDSGVDYSSMPITAHYSILWTAGGVMSTAENMARWSKALYEGALIREGSLGEMLTFVPASVIGALGFNWNGYGLGVRRGSFFGKEVFGHGGQVMGYVSIVAYLPQAKASFAVLLNASEPNEIEFLTALLDAYLRSVPTNMVLPAHLYALSGNSDGAQVYTGDSSSGTLSSLGPYLYGEIVSARVHPKTGKFWGLSSALGWELVQIDGTTGEAFPRLGITLPPGSSTDLKGLDFSPQGTLYICGGDGRIYTVDTTSGAATLAASTGIPLSGLAINPVSGSVWAAIRANASLRDRIYRIDLQTGDTTGVGNTGFSQPLTDIAFDDQGNLFGVVHTGTGVPSNLLARIDSFTGKGTVIGSLGRSGIQTIAFSPSSIPSGVQRPSRRIPAAFRIEQNYPNPFNPATTIRYQIAAAGHVTLKVYNVLGQEVTTLVDGDYAAGSYSATFDGSHLSSGLYSCRLQSGTSVATAKMLLVK